MPEPAGSGKKDAVLSSKQMIRSHTDLQVGLLGRPVKGQATAYNGGELTIKC